LEINVDLLGPTVSRNATTKPESKQTIYMTDVGSLPTYAVATMEDALLAKHVGTWPAA
jgi:hypothetical protein